MLQAKRKELTRLSIVQAALALFSKNNFDSVTVEAITKQANCTKRTFYKYYPSKLALISSIFEERLQELYTLQIKSFVGCATGLDVAICSFENLCEFTKNNLEFMKIFWFIADKHSKDLPEELFERINGWNRMIIDLTATTISQKGITGFWSRQSSYLIVHYLSALNKGIYIHQDKESKLSVMDTTTQELIQITIDNLRYCAQDTPPQAFPSI